MIRLLTFKHDDLTLALTRCSCSALREVAVFVRECGKCKPLYASLIERCKTLPVGTWSNKQSFRFVGGHVHNVTISHFERKETKFVINKTAIYRRNRSSVCLLFVKLALLCVFSSYILPITYTRASREHALDASSRHCIPWAFPLSFSSPWTMNFSQKRRIGTKSENYFQMPDFRDSFTAREVSEGMLAKST